MKQKILDSFFLYLENKGYKRIVDYRNKQIDQQTIDKMMPDISAERKNIQYHFRFEDGTSSETELIKACRVLNTKQENQSKRLKLLVPVESYDTVIQTLNKYQLENVGVIRLNV